MQGQCGSWLEIPHIIVDGIKGGNVGCRRRQELEALGEFERRDGILLEFSQLNARAREIGDE